MQESSLIWQGVFPASFVRSSRALSWLSLPRFHPALYFSRCMATFNILESAASGAKRFWSHEGEIFSPALLHRCLSLPAFLSLVFMCVASTLAFNVSSTFALNVFSTFALNVYSTYARNVSSTIALNISSTFVLNVSSTFGLEVFRVVALWTTLILFCVRIYLYIQLFFTKDLNCSRRSERALCKGRGGERYVGE